MVNCPSSIVRNLERNICALVVKLILLALRPRIDLAFIDHDLSFGIKFDVRSIHRARRGAFKVDAFAVVAAPVARAFEFVLAGLPIRRASEVRADGVDNKETIGCFNNPDAVLLLPLRIDADAVIARRADAHDVRRLENRTRQEEAQEHQKACAEETRDARPDDAAAYLID